VIEVDNQEIQPKENEILFTTYTVGYKGIPYGSTVLLLNNSKDKTLEIVYESEGQRNIIPVQLSNLKNISFSTRPVTVNVDEKYIDYDERSSLIAFAVFGGGLPYMIGSDVLSKTQKLFTPNYNKVQYNTEYEIEIECTINNEEKDIFLVARENPELFIETIKNGQ